MDVRTLASRLTLAQQVTHTRMCVLAWHRINFALPNDEAWIARRLGVQRAEYMDVVAPVIADFWRREGPDLVNDRLRRHAEKAALVEGHQSDG